MYFWATSQPATHPMVEFKMAVALSRRFEKFLNTRALAFASTNMV
jgi:hypothetical protein